MSINVTVNTSIQKTVVTEVAPNQVISVSGSPSTNYIASESIKTVEIGNSLPNLTDYVKTSQTGDFLTSGSASLLYYPLSNPSGFATGIDNSSLVLKSDFNTYTGKFIKFSTILTSGNQSQIISYPFVLSSIPIINCDFQNDQDIYIYNHSISGVNTSNFTVLFSDALSATGYKLMTTVFLN